MKILGIETSCDETGICIIETGENTDNPKIKILGNQLYSQIALHTQYGGVYPMMAKREHALNLTPQLEKCLEEAGMLKLKVESKKLKELEKKVREIMTRELGMFNEVIKLTEKIERPDIDAIAVTNGPGLEPALWVGVTFAKAISEIWNIPLIPTNHMEGHIVVAPLVNEPEPKTYTLKPINYPAIALLISGGHTQLVLVNEENKKLKYEIVGNTKDDAIGEAFDKVARILGLPYPGGPQISKYAELCRTNAELHGLKNIYSLPRPMIHSGDLNFSFSGIKTAVLYLVKKIVDQQSISSTDKGNILSEETKQEIAREFEDAVVEVIAKKTEKAIEQFEAKTIIIGGGVSANKKIRTDFAKLAEKLGVDFMVPEFSASTDNAFMIALAGYINILSGQKPEKDFRANGNLSL